MKIIHRDPRVREFKVLVENLDDLWHLTNILEKNDLVYALTYRREEKKDDKLRAERAEKKKLRIGIRVESWKYHEFADILRIHGTIEDAPFDLGSYHTLNIEVDTKLSIIKEHWQAYQLDRLDEAVKAAKQPLVTFVSIDDDRSVIATLHQYGIRHNTTITGPGHGKRFEVKGEDPMPEYFGQILSHLKQTHSLGSPLIILGPAFFKDDFKKFGMDREPKLLKNSIVENTNQVGMAGIQEALKRGVVTRVLKDARVAIETEMVEHFLIEISKNGLYAYGIDEINKALEVGAVENLLITNDFVRTPKGAKLLDMAKTTGAKVMVISTVHEAGKKLEGFGGAGAILRYKFQA
ncbi:MAG: mRNA surveillance protein pelota [Thermoplasmata archaeon]|nr:MAG: mRNA surveillance protein pelota [Thermoplasmata archaeon]